MLFRYFDVCGVILPVPVFLYGAEYISNDGFLPWEQFEVLTMPFALGMLQRIDECDCSICEGGIGNDFLFGYYDLSSVH